MKSVRGYSVHAGVDEDGFIRRRATSATAGSATGFRWATREAPARSGIAGRARREGYRNHPSSEADKRRDAGIAAARSGAERTFAVRERRHGLGRARFAGLARNLTLHGLACIARDIREGASFPGLRGVAEPAARDR